jgi:hypothetical protein
VRRLRARIDAPWPAISSSSSAPAQLVAQGARPALLLEHGDRVVGQRTTHCGWSTWTGIANGSRMIGRRRPAPHAARGAATTSPGMSV